MPRHGARRAPAQRRRLLRALQPRARGAGRPLPAPLQHPALPRRHLRSLAAGCHAREHQLGSAR
eukprot:3017893-Alexandrium_andersonii.AAC.1